MREQIILGIDVGYSNLGIVSGPEGRPSGCCMPAGAGPAELLPQSIHGGNGRGHGTKGEGVSVTATDGKHWIAGVEPYRFQNWSRDLHAEYPASETYRALIHAGLLKTQEQRIDRLVTGLPVSQYQDKEMRTRLKERLEGTHVINGNKEVEVVKVKVLPQPAGAYLDYISHASDLDVADKGRILIIDIGFYSVDWITIEEGELRMASSGSSVNAMSMALEAANQMFEEQYGAGPGVSRLERSVRAGDDQILLAGRKVSIDSVIGDAADKTAGQVMIELKKTMRADRNALDLLLLVGGGAKHYEPQARTVFGNAVVKAIDNPVMSNPRGFWQAGRG